MATQRWIWWLVHTKTGVSNETAVFTVILHPLFWCFSRCQQLTEHKINVLSFRWEKSQSSESGIFWTSRNHNLAFKYLCSVFTTGGLILFSTPIPISFFFIYVLPLLQQTSSPERHINCSQPQSKMLWVFCDPLLCLELHKEYPLVFSPKKLTIFWIKYVSFEEIEAIDLLLQNFMRMHVRNFLLKRNSAEVDSFQFRICFIASNILHLVFLQFKTGSSFWPLKRWSQ